MKLNLAEQMRDNLARRKTQQNELAPFFRVRPARSLLGTIGIAGAKNAALPLMIASLLTEESVELDNLPLLTDVATLIEILTELGVEVEQHGRTIKLKAANIKTNSPSPNLIKQMRASFWVIAPLLARTGAASVYLPGGDKIGTRAVDIYLDGLRALGAQVETTPHKVDVSTNHLRGARLRGARLRGAQFEMHFPSVGATHVLLMAASLAQGETHLINVAREPEVVALCDLLQKMGATIEGAGSSEIFIQGASTLHAASLTIPADRIEAGTYMIAAALCGGEVKIQNAPLPLLESLLGAMRQAEIPFDVRGSELRGSELVVTRERGSRLAPVDITTAPYPGFPSDLQAQWMALMTQAAGSSSITETLFEQRFQHVPELQKLGADIQLHQQTATITGGKPLQGAELFASDIRASACLILTALAAQSESLVRNIFHLERGFENMEHKFNTCGADIERVSF